MELINRIGGLGKIVVSVREENALKEAWNLASLQTIKYGIFPDDKQTQQFKKIVKGLFTDYPLVARSSMWSGRAWIHQNWYEGIGSVQELAIDSRLPFDRKGPRTDTNLRIIKPENGKDLEYFMTVMIDDTYVPDCRDDVAQILGRRENPLLYGLQQIPEKRVPPRYGIAEVDQLKVALYVLQQATRLVEPMRKSLNELRNNPSCREQYEDDLHRLTNQ